MKKYWANTLQGRKCKLMRCEKSVEKAKQVKRIGKGVVKVNCVCNQWKSKRQKNHNRRG